MNKNCIFEHGDNFGPSGQLQWLKRPSSLWSLHAFVLYITWSDVWKANLYAFCLEGGMKVWWATQNSMLEQAGKSTWLSKEGTGDTNEPKAYDMCLGGYGKSANLPSIAEWSGLKSFCKHRPPSAFVVRLLLSTTPLESRAIQRFFKGGQKWPCNVVQRLRYQYDSKMVLKKRIALELSVHNTRLIYNSSK